MKEITGCLLAGTLIVSLAGCASAEKGTQEASKTLETTENQDAEETKETEEIEEVEETKETQETASSQPYTVVTDRVIEVTFNEWDSESAAAYLDKYDTAMGACSAVKVILDGNVYVGRNYDFYCSDAPAFIVRNNSGSIRTIGIGNMPLTHDAWSDDFTLSDKEMLALPYSCCDVMSEAGIFAETNVRMNEEAFSCSSTNPGAPRRCTQTFMQTMLSQYSTIDEILSHVDDYDWFDLTALGFQQSFFLTDQTGYSVVVEFAANSWKATETDVNANYYIDADWFKEELMPCGIKRIELETEYLPNIKEADDIFTMMERGAYDQFYRSDGNIDAAVEEFYSVTGYNKITAAEDYEGAKAATQKLMDTYGTYTWEQRIREKTWESTFITVADVTNLRLDVHFSEHYNIAFTVDFENSSADDSLITLPKSDEAKKYEEEVLPGYDDKAYLSEDRYNQIVEGLSKRSEQVLPECDVKNSLACEEWEGSNVYTLTKDGYENVILYIHGGAWVFEINESHVTFCDDLADRLNAKVYMPLYPLAPEANGEETFSFIESLYKEILKGNENKKIYVMGDSAGGNISLGLMYTIKEENLKKPEKMVLMAPVSDLTFSNEELVSINETDPELDLYGLTRYAALWAGQENLKNPKYSPVYADVEGYPDTMFIQGTNDILCPDNLILYQNMKDAGVNAKFVKGEGLWHVFPVFPIPEREKVLDLIEEFCTE